MTIKKNSFLVILAVMLILPLAFMLSGCFGNDGDNDHYDQNNDTCYAIQIEQITGGTVTASKTSAKQGEVITLSNTANSGYTFVEYYIYDANEQSVAISNNTFTMPPCDVTISALFEDNTVVRYTISIQQVTGGTIAASKTKAEQGEQVNLSYLANTGYTFVEYSVKDSQNNVIPVENGTFTMPANDVTVSGRFTSVSTQIYMIEIIDNDYGAITFSANPKVDNKEYEDSDLVYGGARVTLRFTIYNSTFYRFISWDVRDENNNNIVVTDNSFAMPMCNVIVAANVEEIKYPITIDESILDKCDISVYVSESDDNTQARYLSYVRVECTPKAGYTFNGWVIQNGTNYLNGRNTQCSFSVSGNVTISAEFSYKYYTVKIISNSHANLLAVKDSQDRNIIHQSTGSSHVGEVLQVVFVPSANYRFDALYITPYTVSPQGQYYSDEPIEYDENYKFTMPAKDVQISLELQFIDDNYYTISYDLEDDAVNAQNNPTHLLSGDGSISVYEATRPGYEFSYWIDQNNNRYKEFINAAQVGENLTLSAVWNQIYYRISFNANSGDGEIETMIFIGYEQEVSLSQNTFTKEYYSFVGWALSADGEALYQDEAIVSKLTTTQDETVELFAVWAPISYTITYIDDNGTSTTNYTIQDKITIKNSEKTGYSFDYYQVTETDGNWNKDVHLTNGSELSNMHGNATLTAHYIINQYSITFVLDNGEDNIVITQDYGTTITPPNNPEKTGNTFAGWDNEIPQTMPAQNTTITATYNPNTYQINYFDKDSESFSGTHEENYPIQFVHNVQTVLDIPTKTGYTFGGYYLQSDCSDSRITNIQTQTSDVTLYAKWEPITYSIEFRGPGIHDYAYQTLTYDTPANLQKQSFTRKKYHLVGWTTDRNQINNPEMAEYQDEQEVLNLSSTQGDQITLYAVWAKDVYTLTFVNQDGSPWTTMEYIGADYDYNQRIEFPTKEYYSLDHWQVIDGVYHDSYRYTTSNGYKYTEYEYYAEDGHDVITAGNDYGYYPWGNATIKGYFTINQYTLTIKDGDEILYTSTQDYGTAIDLQAIQQATTKIGYDLVDYDTQLPTLMPAQNLTINTIWQAQVYNIVYKVVGGGDITGATFENYPTIHKFDEETTLVYPNKPDYNAVGWFTNIDGTGESYIKLPANTVSGENGELVLYIRFEELVVTYVVYGAGDNMYAQINGVTAFGATQSNFIIPTYINGVKTKIIAMNALKDQTHIKMLTIPSTVTSIDRGALKGLSGLVELVNLSNVTLRKGINYVGMYEQAELYPAVITNDPNYVSHIQRYDNGVYYCVNGNTIIATDYDGNEQNLVLDENCTGISGWAFCGSNFEQLTIPSKVAYIDRYAFQNCTSLETVYFNAKNCECDDLSTASTTLFYGCTNLQTMIFGEGVEIIPYSIGSQLDSLTTVNIPSTVKYIRSRVFNNCTGLQTVTFAQNSVCESFGSQSFGNTAITSIQLPENLKSIYDSSFEDCKYLLSITIPASVNNISNNAFFGCVALASIVVEAGNTVYDSRNNCNAIIESSSNKLYIGCTNTAIPNDVIEIGSYAFHKTGITSIHIPGNIKNIGQSAFHNCESLQTLTFGDGVEKLGAYAFANCTSLTSVTFANSINEIGSSAFWQCTNLETVKLSSGLESIRTSAFSSCEKLVNVYITNDTIYNAATNVWDPGQVLYRARNVYVLDSVYENTDNTNEFLTDSTIFNQPTGTVTVDENEYYLFTKVTN